MTDASTSQDHFDTPTPAADLQALGERLVGAWRVSGGTQGTVRYEWMDGGFFLIQHVELEQYGQQTKGMELIGRLRPFGEPQPGHPLPLLRQHRQHPGLCVRAGGRHPHHLGRGEGSPAYFRGTFSADSNTLTSEWVYPGERLPGNQHQDRQLTSHDTRRPRRPGVMPLRAPRRRPRRRRMEWRAAATRQPPGPSPGSAMSS